MIYGEYPYDSSTAATMYREIQTRRLFNKSDPFTFNDHTPSQEVYNFLKFTIVVETERRPDWRAVAEYPNIKNLEDLGQRFIKQCDVVVNQELNYGETLEDDRPIA